MNESGRATERIEKGMSCLRSTVSVDPHGPTVRPAQEKAEYRPRLLGSPAHCNLQVPPLGLEGHGQKEGHHRRLELLCWCQQHGLISEAIQSLLDRGIQGGR